MVPQKKSNLVGGLEHEFYFSIYWEYSSQLTNTFQRDWNHQPATFFWCVYRALRTDSIDSLVKIPINFGEVSRGCIPRSKWVIPPAIYNYIYINIYIQLCIIYIYGTSPVIYGITMGYMGYMDYKPLPMSCFCPFPSAGDHRAVLPTSWPGVFLEEPVARWMKRGWENPRNMMAGW